MKNLCGSYDCRIQLLQNLCNFFYCPVECDRSSGDCRLDFPKVQNRSKLKKRKTGEILIYVQQIGKPLVIT